MSSYKVSVGGVVVARAGTFREAGVAVMEAITSLLAQDFAGVEEGAAMANRAFSVGTVEHALEAQGSWRTVVRVHGEPVVIDVRKRRWFL